MARIAIESDFRTSGSHFVTKFTKIKLWYWSEMVRSDFWTSKMATGGHFKKKTFTKKSCASDLNNVRTDCWPTTTWYKFIFGQYIYRQVCWERGNIHCDRPLGWMHTILVVPCACLARFILNNVHKGSLNIISFPLYRLYRSSVPHV